MYSLLAFLLYFFLRFQAVMSESVCKGVTCYGQSICHELSIPCYNKSVGCTQIVAQCSDKTIEDYAKDLMTEKNMEQILKNPDYLNSNDKDVLCQGFNCFGMNTCVIILVPCVDDPTCINYQPFCDDSPIPIDPFKIK